LLTTVFYLLFGISEEAAKYCMAFYGFIAIPLIYLLSIRVFNDKRVRIVTATFLAVCPLHWFYSTAVMGDVVSMFFVLASIYTPVMGENERKRSWSILSGFFAGFSVFI
jgi:4-amino-4-deoxy-L-arabinose transferase-like glycosyltransferase